MSTLYVLLLENEKYYIGRTANIDKRLEEHTKGNGAEWTALNKVVKVVEVIKDCKPQDEDSMTIKYMAKHGIENVRGGTFCSVVLPPDTIKLLKKMTNTQNLTCYRCDAKGHYANECSGLKSIDSVICYNCGKKGHYATRCPEPKQNFRKETTEQQQKQQIKINSTIEQKEITINPEQKIMRLIALRSWHGKWLCFDSPSKSSIVSADRDNIGNFEKFAVVYAENAEIKLFCPKHKTYLAATTAGDVYQAADANDPAALWKIEIISLNIKNERIEKLGIMHVGNKRYLCAERPNFFGYSKVVANREFLKSFETWEICYL